MKMHPLRHVDENGSCLFCGQHKITSHHRCNGLIEHTKKSRINSIHKQNKPFQDDGDVGRDLNHEIEYIKSGREKRNFGC